MQKHIEKWEDVPHAQYVRDVFHLQRRIFSSSKQGNHELVHKLQRLLLSSTAAKCLAVHKVTEKNAGRDTAGIDGERGLTDAAKLRLATSLSLHHPVMAVKRVWIPKPGKNELRPLGIPTMKDRALQALIVLALEPEWEAKFTPGTYGFRKGYSTHDAIVTIRSSIQQLPKWVLDADIEKFFDRVDHQALLSKLNTFPALESAIRRILKAGIVDGSVATRPEAGTPQGGPLSPLLANIVLSGLETDLRIATQTWETAKKRSRPIAMFTYADDLSVLHEDREIIERSREFISDWLAKVGLNLHPKKTRIVHTLQTSESGQAGFDFLGHNIRQFHTGKYALKPFFKQVHTQIGPSKGAVRRAYHELALIIQQMLAAPNYRHCGSKRRVSILLYRLNPKIRGWSNYYRHCNSKAAFSRLDHLVWHKIWKALRNFFRNKGRTWTVQTMLRYRGKWQLNCQDPTGKTIVLRLFAETSIQRHFPVQKGRSYYDGDALYWATRTGAYPGLPTEVGKLLKSQRAHCPHCGQAFSRDERWSVLTNPAKEKPWLLLIHHQCESEFRRCHDNANAVSG